MNRKYLSFILVLVLVSSLGFVSAVDISKSWDCANSLGGCVNFKVCSDQNQDDCLSCGLARPVYAFKPEANFRFSNYYFNAPVAGSYSCTINVVETGHGYYHSDSSPQTEENSDVWLNANYLGRSVDGACNSEYSCKSCADKTTEFVKVLDLTTTGNHIKLESFESHALRRVAISCDYIPPVCVPVDGGWSATSYSGWTECADGVRDRTLTQTCNNPIPNSCGSDCVTTPGWTKSGNVQTKIETESCEYCVEDSITNSANSSYCSSNVFNINNSYFICQDNDWNFFNNLIYQEDCSYYSEDYSDYYCLDEDTSARNLTIVNGVCSEQGCANESSTDVVDQEDCVYGCYNGRCINQTSVPPIVTIVKPENIVYRTLIVPFNVIANQVIDLWRYAINNSALVPFVESNSTLSFNNTGVYRLDVIGENENGVGADFVYFTIEMSHRGD